MRARYRWEAALVGVTAVWGGTFVVVQDAIEQVPPHLFNAMRFALATAAMAAVGAFRGTTRADLRAGGLVGLALFGGYAFQTVGLQYTTPSNAGFITGLFVVFTPLIVAATERRIPRGGALPGAALATAGLFLLAAPAGVAIGGGDALVLAAAFSFAVHIVLLGRLGHGRPPVRIAAIQLATAAVASAAWSGIGEQTAPALTGTVVFAVVVTGLLASALAFWIQTAAQRVVPPTRTSIILTSEPVFAGIFGFWLAGDRLGPRALAGAALILTGIAVAELRSRERVPE